MKTLGQMTSSITDRIGNTPLIKLSRAVPQSISPKVEIFAKAEWFNPGGSVKDRAAFSMIQKGRASGAFQEGQTLIDSTSGNTGIAYAMIGSALGFPVTIVMPDNASRERKVILKAYGAEIIESDGLQGSDGARKLAEEIVEKEPRKYFFPDQYSNDANWQAHYETTGPEIWRDTEGKVTHFVAGIGTSGTMMGTGRYLKEQNSEIRMIALQPEDFPGIEGWKNMDYATPVRIYDESVHDERLTLKTEPAAYWARELAAKEGLLVSQSAGAAFYGAIQVAEKLDEGLVVVVFADGGDKYLSTDLWR